MPSKPQATSPLQRLTGALLAPTDALGVVYFRLVFYAVMVWESWRLYDNNWVRKYFSDEDFHFKFWPFTFVEPLPESTLEVFLLVMGGVALSAFLGLFYRLTSALFFGMITYLFLIDQARFLNHLYLICLIAFLMIFVPAHRTFSLDARLWPRRASREVAAWSLWLLRFQVGVPYFFGGVAKLNHDWLRGEPMRDWLGDRTDFPVLGKYFESEGVVWAMSNGAIVLDLAAPILLCFRRTRTPAFLATLTFHFLNARLFNIGVFPWTMIAATVIFFDPEWPRRLWRDLREGHRLRSPAFAGGAVFGAFTGAFLPEPFSWVKVAIGALGVGVLAYHLDEPWSRPSSTAQPSKARAVPSSQLSPATRWGLYALAAWVAVQIALPLRHYAIPGDVHWTDEGHLYAWHMKIRNKSGRGDFVVRDPATGKAWVVDPDDHLTNFQLRKMRTRPQLIVQYAHYLEELARAEGHADVEVRARIRARLNGRKRVPLIDPEVDLTTVPFPWWGHAEWILPLEEPLPVP